MSTRRFGDPGSCKYITPIHFTSIVPYDYTLLTARKITFFWVVAGVGGEFPITRQSGGHPVNLPGQLATLRQPRPAVEADYHAFLAARGFAKTRGTDEEGYADNLMASFDALPPELQVDSWVADETVRFIRRHGGRGEPFFAMVGFPGPHDPYNPPKDWVEDWDPSSMPESRPPTHVTETFRQGQIRQNRLGSAAINMERFPEDVKRRIRVHYSALTSNIDSGVSRNLAAQDERGLSRNTVVIATSDHRDLLGDFDLLGKSNFLKSSISIPLIVRAPGTGPAGRSDALVTLTGFFPPSPCLQAPKPAGAAIALRFRNWVWDHTDRARSFSGRSAPASS